MKYLKPIRISKCTDKNVNRINQHRKQSQMLGNGLFKNRTRRHFEIWPPHIIAGTHEQVRAILFAGLF